ncbi:MAG: family 16 glycoside hydrolase [Bacteroidia bacterium]|jgi:Domain of Unknown Function (DUF1080)/Carbohydrate binding domain (family 11)
MKQKISTALFVILFAFLQTTVCMSKPVEKDGKWITIFNGKNLDGWTPKVTGYQSGENPLNNFRVEDGIMRVDYSKFAAFNGRFGHIFYKEKLSSFILHVEYRFVGELLPDAPSYCIRNSGVMVCSQSPESMDVTENWPVSIEVQLLGCTDKIKQTTANICTPGTTVSVKGIPTSEHCINANSKYYNNGEWVNLDIVVHSGKEIINIVNGDTVLVTSEPRIGGFLLPENYPVPDGTLLQDGYIALQAEGQPIDFRNIKLQILDDKNVTVKKTETPPKPAGLKVIDNFDHYTSNEQLTKAWYHPGHGAANTRTLEPKIKAAGKYSLKCEYTTNKSEDQFYVPFCRVNQWDLSGCNGVQFWFKPDGSGREMTFQLNIANKEGKNIHDLWEYTYLTEKGNTDGRWVIIPFFNLKHNTKYADAPDVSPTFKPEAVIEAAFYIGGRNDEPGSGTVYFDEISGASLQF